jgi:ATP synthase subunit 6
MNLIGLTPFTYGGTSSLWTARSLALVLWFSLLLSGWVKFPKESAAHLAPAGAPGALIPFLVLVETIRILIRPLTLTVRLIANIRAGHIVISLISNCLRSVGIITIIPLLAVNVGYTLFEVFVCFIQAYIFSLLVKLYSEEHP